MVNRNEMRECQLMESMREYLSAFFEDFQYDEVDADFLISVYDCIVDDPDAQNALIHSLKLYESDYCCDYNEIFKDSEKIAELTGYHEHTLDLLMFICLSKHLKELYVEKGMDLDYYRKSMLDLKYKLDECKLVYGTVGTFVGRWFPGFFKLTRFGIGRLQFEIGAFKTTYDKNGILILPEDNVLHMHIPRSGEPLTEQACEDAYVKAKAFFMKFFKDQMKFDPCPFSCYSYLLYPETENFIPKNTNTYRFLKSFDVFYSCVDRNRDNLWRLFDTQEKNLDKLPTDTSMRRAYVEHMKNGGKIGVGKGVLFL